MGIATGDYGVSSPSRMRIGMAIATTAMPGTAHSRTEAASDGSPGRSYTTAELVPSGWQLQPTDPNLNGQRFASPDGEGSLAIYASSAEQEPIAKHMNAIAFVEGEQITHLRREEDWIEVAGFKADHSFYRKAVLACAGRVWHEVAFEYPTQSLEEITKFVGPRGEGGAEQRRSGLRGFRVFCRR